MSARADTSRRASVEIRFTHASAALPMIGERALYQYWSLLAPHFRGVLLAPQWRSAGDGVAWTWCEPAAAAPLSAAEIAIVRKRLASAQRAFADAAAEAAPTDVQRAAVSLVQIEASTATVINALIALPDPALSAYVARSESSPLLHSWGLATALVPFYPDIADKLISGTVFIAQQPAPGQEVLLETPEGQPVAHLHSDSTGHFNFEKIAPGQYRLRVTSTLVAFPPAGLRLEIQRVSATDLALHDSAGARSARNSHGQHPFKSRHLFFILAAVLLLGLLWIFLRTSNSSLSSPRPTAAASPQIFSVTGPAQISRSLKVGSARPADSTFSRARTVADLDVSRPAPHSAPYTTTREHALPPAPPSSNSASASAPPTSTGPGASNPSAGISSPTHSASNATAATSPSSAPAQASSSTANSAPPASNSPSRPTSASSAASSHSALSSPSNLPRPPADNNPLAHPSSPLPTPAPKTAPLSRTPSTRSPTANPLTPPSSATASAAPTAEMPAISPSLPDVNTEGPNNSTPGLLQPNLPHSLPANSPRPPVPEIDKPALPSVTDSDSITPNSPAPLITRVFSHRIRLRLTPWTTRLLQDTILPTQPVRVGAPQSLDTLRTQVFRERQRQIPASFQSPNIRRGFAFDLPTLPSRSSLAQWRASTGAIPPGAVVNGAHAELSWSAPAGASASPTTLHLTASGRELARVTIDANGEASVLTPADVRVWPWCAFLTAKSTTSSDSERRFIWQVLQGPPAPATWLRTTSAQNPVAHRLDLIESGEEIGQHQRTVAVLDQVTGWALVSELEQVSDGAPPEVATP